MRAKEAAVRGWQHELSQKDWEAMLEASIVFLGHGCGRARATGQRNDSE